MTALEWLRVRYDAAKAEERALEERISDRIEAARKKAAGRKSATNALSGKPTKEEKAELSRIQRKLSELHDRITTQERFAK